MTYSNPIIDKMNATVGIAIAILTYIFGESWWLFAAFLFMNVCDWITGWYKSRILRKETSEKGWKGVAKKFLYWVIIAMSFVMSAVFIEVGEIIGIDLHITTIFGWFVLASLFVNEIRSIIENLVEAGIYVPAVLKKGLEVADDILESIDGEDEKEDEG